MSLRPLSIALFAALLAAWSLHPGRAEAQAKLATDQIIMAPIGTGTSDFVIFDRNLVEQLARGGEFDNGIPGSTPGAGSGNRGVIMVCDRKLPFDPVVGPSRVGFLNTTDAAVKFVFDSDGATTIHELAGREFMTLEAPASAVLKGTVSTSNHDATLDLEPGGLYLLKGEAGHWVFARL